MVHVAPHAGLHEHLVVRGAHRALLIRWATKGRTKQRMLEWTRFA